MASTVEKVALITGAARGMGRAHALRLADDGADVILIDIARPEAGEGLSYELAKEDELETTRAEVESRGRRAFTARADVRDRAALDTAVADGVAALGRLDVVVANAGISPKGQPAWTIDREDWDRVIDINLTGVWQTIAACVPTMIAAERGGAIVVISSTSGQRGYPNLAAYVASKYGVEGLVRTLANELGEHRIRVNAVAPTMVNTALFANESIQAMLRPDLDAPTQDDVDEVTKHLHAIPVPGVEPEDVANAVGWLASDDARYVTGTTILVDAGHVAKTAF